MHWNDLEKMIGKYRERFDEDNPSPNHMVSFEAKLQKRFKKSNTFKQQKVFMRIAASIAVLIIGAYLSYLIYDNVKRPLKNNIITQTTSELQETEMYYTKQINKGLEQIKSLEISDQKQKTAILSDLNSMDKNYDQLKTELKSNPDDERLVHAIIEHYQVKLDAIDQIINSISFSQNNLKPQS
jgi:hypothetical protein